MARRPRYRRASIESAAWRRPSKGTSTSKLRDGVLHFIGGKGGVGKTTCAAAIALADAARGRRTLLISTDPASSLADALRQPVTRRPSAVRGRARLQVADIDAPRALSTWLARRRPILARIALRGTWLDKEDVARLLRLSLPGIDEIAALLEIARHVRGGRYECIVVDTAPTGHTLRMLEMPDALRAIAHVFDDMQAKHRVMAEALSGRWAPDAADYLIEELDSEGAALIELLRDESRVRVSWVTLPEELAVAETLDALRSLEDRAIPVTRLIVNRLTPPPPNPCRWCAARRVTEARALAPLSRAHPRLARAAVPARAVEPRGVQALLSIARDIERAASVPAGRGRRLRARGTGTIPAKPGSRIAAAAVATAGVQLVMFGGKGGVGKTTCAAAAALVMARRDPDRRVLLLSTDPAHSLGDAFDKTLSDHPQAVARGVPNLRVRELDASGAFDRVRAQYGAAVDAIFDRLSRGSAFDATHDRRVMRDLIDLAPPGIDEIVGILEVTDALIGNAADVVVVDTAPTGHALRLLEMPALVQDWTKALMSVLLKYQAVAGPGDLGRMLLRLSQGIGRVRELLVDSQRTRFIAVTRAAALPREETLWLIAELRALRITVPLVVVNAVGAGTCDYCRQVIRAERTELGRLQRALGSRSRVVAAPAEMPPPRGAAALARWGRGWTAL